MALTENEKTRYDRQMMVEGWGEAGQEKLKAATVFIAGAGGLGCPVSVYLAVAGVGQIRICDADRVELSNLNRQIHYTEAQVGQSKAEAAGARLRELNPNVDVVPRAEYLDEGSIERLAGDPDIVVDCLDNFETRYLLNAYCLEKGIPLVHAAVWGMSGQVCFLQPPKTPCLKCVFPDPPPKATFPVVGATPGLAACVQAMETLKFLTGVGANLANQLLIFDGEEMDWKVFTVKRLPSCPACGQPQ